MFLPRLALLTAACLGVAAGATAQRSVLKNALPADTILFVSLPDLDKSVQELLDMPLARMWRQAELQQVLAPAMAMLKEQWEQGIQQAAAMHEQGMLPFAPDELLKLRLYGATFAVTHVDVVADGPMLAPDFGVVLHLDFGPSASIWRKILDFGLAQLEAQGGEMLTKSQSDVGGTKLTTWQPEGVPISLNLAWLGDGIVFSTSQRVVQNVLTALAEKKEVLTAAKEYRAVAANVGDPDAEVEAFLNIERGMNTLFGVLDKIAQNEADFPEEIDLQGIRRAVDALGLSAVKAFGGTSTYKGNAAVSKSYILCPAPERRGLVADGSKNLDLDCLKWVPKKAVTCSATTLNLTAVWDALVDAVRAYDEQAAEGLLAHLGGVEKQMGFSIRDDLCGAFGSQMVTWSLPMQGMPGLGGGSLYNGMILVQMRDHERLLKVLESLKQVAGAMLDFGSNTRDDLTTYYVKLRGDAFADAFAGMPFNPGDLLEMLTPVFAFQNGYMVLGFSRSDVRRTVRAMTEGLGENEDIRANKAFADVLKSLDAERLVSLSFSDNRTSFESFYEMAYGFTAMVPDTVPLDMASLPDDGSFLGQHLFPSISYSYSDGNGFSSTQHGPFGPEMGLVIGAAIGAGAAAGVATAQEMRPRRR